MNTENFSRLFSDLNNRINILVNNPNDSEKYGGVVAIGMISLEPRKFSKSRQDNLLELDYGEIDGGSRGTKFETQIRVALLSPNNLLAFQASKVLGKWNSWFQINDYVRKICSDGRNLKRDIRNCRFAFETVQFRKTSFYLLFII